MRVNITTFSAQRNTVGPPGRWHEPPNINVLDKQKYDRLYCPPRRRNTCVSLCACMVHLAGSATFPGKKNFNYEA
jgi:hypothetical protein